MKFGVAIFPTDYSIAPHRVAKEAEDRGFESIFFPEHTIFRRAEKPPGPAAPNSRRNTPTRSIFSWRWGPRRPRRKNHAGHGHLPRHRARPHHPRQRGGHARSHIERPRALRRGRRWNREEMETTERAMRSARLNLRERIEAMKAIWTEDEASYHGDFRDFERIWSWPKPIQKPHPRYSWAETGRERSNAWCATEMSGCRCRAGV